MFWDGPDPVGSIIFTQEPSRNSGPTIKDKLFSFKNIKLHVSIVKTIRKMIVFLNLYFLTFIPININYTLLKK